MLKVSYGELKDRALNNLRGNWGNAIGAYLVLGLCSGILNVIPVIGPLGTLIITGPLYLGAAMFALKYSNDARPEIGVMFDGFKNFGNALVTFLLMTLIVLGFTLLLIIPGIIRAYSYSQVFFILAKEPNIKPMDALKKSRAMMDGYKWNLFVLNLSFIGWVLLVPLTLYIGLLWLIPYMRITFAHFHKEVSGAYTGTDGTEDIGTAGEV